MRAHWHRGHDDLVSNLSCGVPWNHNWFGPGGPSADCITDPEPAAVAGWFIRPDEPGLLCRRFQVIAETASERLVGTGMAYRMAIA